MIAMKSRSAFTLLELLTVIGILGLIAALAIPAFRSFGKSDTTLSASRQLLDGVARARQIAMSQRTTVYMVFVPTNFWNDSYWLSGLTPDQKSVATNLADRQLSGYIFMANHAVGDQPGVRTWHYLANRWQWLPDGSFVALQKFSDPPGQAHIITDPINGRSFTINGFNISAFPFPTVTATNTMLPFIAFNYLGQLTFDGKTVADRDEYLPLASGSVMYRFNAPVDVQENPPGNSTNISYNIVHIDHLTGRANLEFHHVQ